MRTATPAFLLLTAISTAQSFAFPAPVTRLFPVSASLVARAELQYAPVVNGNTSLRTVRIGE